MKRLAFSAILLTLAGCTQGTLDRPQLAPSAASFTYYTPQTRLSITGDLVLLRCDAEGVIATSSLALVAAGGADRTAPFTLEGSYLSSAVQRRELSIDLYDNGTIKSLNATTTDRTGTVITSILSTAASIVGAVAGVRPANLGPGGTTPRNPGPCNDQTYEALQQAAGIRAVLAAEQRRLQAISPADVEGTRIRIDTLANQLAALLANQLTISLTRRLEVGDGLTAPAPWQPLRWNLADLRKWFGQPSNGRVADSCKPAPTAVHLFRRSATSTDDCEATTDLFAIDYAITPTSAAPLDQRAARSPCRTPTPELTSQCGRSIVLPEPVPAVARFRAASDNIANHPTHAQLGQASVLMPQWGRATYLPLNVRIFQTRSIGFAFSPFGERQSFKWNSEATAENALSTISAATDTLLTGIRNAEGPSDTQRWTEEAAELEARMKINRLRRCEFAIQAGATTCEEE